MSHFSQNLEHAKTRIASRPKEVIYLKKYLPRIIAHLEDIKNENPDITEKEFNDILFNEIDDYASTVYETSYIFSVYMDYISCQYLQNHRDTFDLISEKVANSDINYDAKPHTECSSFEEYLELYIYNFKSDLFDLVFNGYMENTPENCKNFDKLFNENKKGLAKFFFDEYFSLPQVADVICSDSMDRSKKIAKLKEFSTWYKSPADRKRFNLFTNLFMNGSFTYLSDDQILLENLIRKDISKSTESIITHLDSLGHLDDYINSYVLLMCNLGFPEFATPFCDNGLPNKDFANKISSLSTHKQISKIAEIVNKDKFKTSISSNFLSSNTIPIESLIALNSFWSNRYIKELDMYSEAMFAIHDFGLIPKILNGEKIDISDEGFEQALSEMLIKMNFFYSPSTYFLNKMQNKIDHDSNLKNNKEISEEDVDTVEEKIIRYSYEPFISFMTDHFGEQYKDYFSKTCTYSDNNISEDCNWYIRLINPIVSSYSMKNETINALIASIENSETCKFPNAGIILEEESIDGTFSDIPYSVGIGIDAGLSSPVRIHTKKPVLIDFVKTINNNAIIPIYEGANDFKSDSGLPIPTHIISPITEKHKNILKKALKNLNSYNNKSFVSHLGFIDDKHSPEHLRTSVFDSHGRKKEMFVRRYIDLETGEIYKKVDENYVKVEPNSSRSGGDSEYEH